MDCATDRFGIPLLPSSLLVRGFRRSSRVRPVLQPLVPLLELEDQFDGLATEALPCKWASLLIRDTNRAAIVIVLGSRPEVVRAKLIENSFKNSASLKAQQRGRHSLFRTEGKAILPIHSMDGTRCLCHWADRVSE